MASVASQLIEKVTAHAQSDSLEDAQEICADGTYFPNNLRMCFVWISNRSYFPVQHLLTGCITATECVYCAVRVEYSYKIRLILVMKILFVSEYVDWSSYIRRFRTCTDPEDDG